MILIKTKLVLPSVDLTKMTRGPIKSRHMSCNLFFGNLTLPFLFIFISLRPTSFYLFIYLFYVSKECKSLIYIMGL